jgi:hypothetical protein
MRVRVRFRYRADTGEIEMFQVDGVIDGLPDTDHDARHDRAAADVARVVEANPMVEEVAPGTRPAWPAEDRDRDRDGDRSTTEETGPETGVDTPGEDRRIRD